MNVPVLYLVQNEHGEALTLAKSDDEKQLRQRLGEQYPGQKLILLKATDAPLEQVAQLVLCLHAEWVMMQFALVQNAPGIQAGRIVRPS